MTDNVYTLRTRKFPNDVRKLLEKLLAHVDDPKRPIEGFAFVAYIDDAGFIADAVGKARTEAKQTRRMLHTLDAKLARWQT